MLHIGSSYLQIFLVFLLPPFNNISSSNEWSKMCLNNVWHPNPHYLAWSHLLPEWTIASQVAPWINSYHKFSRPKLPFNQISNYIPQRLLNLGTWPNIWLYSSIYLIYHVSYLDCFSDLGFSNAWHYLLSVQCARVLTSHPHQWSNLKGGY